MVVELVEAGMESLGAYARIPSLVRVASVLVLDAPRGGLDGLALHEEPIASPYTKDYDAHGGPADWPARFDVRHWRVVLAREGREVLAAAALADPESVAWPDPTYDALVLWDIRVAAARRRSGLGSSLLQRAAGIARRRGAKRLLVETQNVNVPACRFYAARGCTLAGIDRDAYRGEPDVAHEVRLNWTLDLD